MDKKRIASAAIGDVLECFGVRLPEGTPLQVGTIATASACLLAAGALLRTLPRNPKAVLTDEEAFVQCAREAWAELDKTENEKRPTAAPSLALRTPSSRRRRVH